MKQVSEGQKVERIRVKLFSVKGVRVNGFYSQGVIENRS